MNNYNFHISNDKKDLAVFSATYIANLINKILMTKERVQISLCGGSTPFETYKILGQKIIPWERVDLFLGDERWVDTNSSESNSHMIRNSLLLDGNTACSAFFYPVCTLDFNNVEESAFNYSVVLKEKLSGNPPSFDLTLLGLGDDGHTASLFPGSEALNIKEQLVTVGDGKGHSRITCTAFLLSSSKNIIFLVSGKSKQVALKRLIDNSEPSKRTPARLIQSETKINVLTDKDAIKVVEIN